MTDVRKRLIINERIKAMEMLLDAEWITAIGGIPGYFKATSGKYYSEDGHELDNPWLTGLKKNG